MPELSAAQSETQLPATQNDSAGPASIRTIRIRGDAAWVGRNNTVAERINLNNPLQGTQRYHGHGDVVNCVKVYDTTALPDSTKPDYILTGSADKGIRVWEEAQAGGPPRVFVTENAHNDASGVRSLFVIPSKKLLLSSGLNPMVGLWNLSELTQELPKLADGNIAKDDTGRADCLALGPTMRSGGGFKFFTGHCDPETGTSGSEPGVCVLNNAGTNGSIGKFMWAWVATPRSRMTSASATSDAVQWDLSCNSIPTEHTKGITDMIYVAEGDQLWTASEDETVKVHVNPRSESPAKPLRIYTLGHDAPVRAIFHVSNPVLEKPYVISGAGKTLRVWAVDDLANIKQVHKEDLDSDVVAIRLWKPSQGQNNQVVVACVNGSIVTYNLNALVPQPLQLSSPAILLPPTKNIPVENLSQEMQQIHIG